MKVLVVTARGLHLGYVAAYGNEWVETPALDRLAAEGVVFDRHIAERPDPAGARRAWRSGRCPLPPPEGDEAAEPAPDLLPLLKDAGVVTSLVLDASRPAPADFADGWDVVMEAEGDDDASALEYALEGAAQALDSLVDSDDWLLWLDLASLLPPWDVPDDYLALYPAEPPGEDEGEEDGADGEAPGPLLDPPAGLIDVRDDPTFLRLQRGYAAAVSHLDAHLDMLLKELGERRLLDDVLLIVNTDHGLPLGEHGAVGLARPWLHDELVHLPLLLRLPGGAEGGRRVPALTQPADLMATLLDAFGLPPAPAAHGHSLLPLARGAATPPRPYACSGLRVGASAEWALRSPGWAFLLPLAGEAGEVPRPPQLYVKPDDRWEVNNVAQHHPELCAHLEEVLRGFAEAARRPGPLHAPELRDVEAAAGEQAEGPTAEQREGTMSTVKLVDEGTTDPRVRAVFDDIKATKKIDRIPNIWRALAVHPEHLELCWTRLKAIMRPGKLDGLTKEIIALAVSATNGCNYCINSHTAAVQKLGLDAEAYSELLAVVGLYNQMNKLADALQVEPDVRPQPF